VTLGPSEGILPDHLVSYWSFDGNANDSWGTNNGTCTGGTCPTLTTGVKGLVNTAYSFDGVDDWISCGVPISSSFSYSFWLNQRNLQYWTGLIDGTDLQSVVYTYDFIHWAKSSGLYLDGSSFSLNTWHHFVLTYNISTNVIEIFKDGVFNVNTTPNYPTSSFSIQKLGRVSSYYLNGILDNVRVYNKALTTDEIQMIYNVEKP
jgi:hypothetical protein